MEFISRNVAGWKKSLMLVLKQLRDTISDVAKNWCKQGLEKDKILSSLTILVYEKFMEKYGLKSVADKNMEKLINYIMST